MQREKGVRWGAKISGLYIKEPLGERKPSPSAGKFRVEGRVCYPGPVTR